MTPPTCIRVASGRLVDLLDLKPEDVLLSDIARGLAGQERFGGHAPLHPTIAQHSLAVEHIAGELYRLGLTSLDDGAVPNALLRYALMHDAAEAYVGDVSAPAKRALRRLTGKGHLSSTFDVLEYGVQVAISTRFACPMWDSAIVHRADRMAYEYESAWGGWSEQELPDWLNRSLYVRRCYRAPNQDRGGHPYKDGGEAAFLRRARALGMSDDA